MKKTIITTMFLLMVIAVACVSGTAQDDVSVTKSISFPGTNTLLDSGTSIVNVIPVTTEQSTSFDVSDSVSKLSDVGDVTLSVNQSTLSGDVGFIRHVKIMLSPTNDDPSRPPVVLVDADASDPNTLQLPIALDTATLTDYLSQGSVTLDVILTGTIPSEDVMLTDFLSVHADVGVKKSLSDIGKKK